MSDLRLIWKKMKEMKDNMKESVPFVMLMTVLHIHLTQVAERDLHLIDGDGSSR